MVLILLLWLACPQPFRHCTNFLSLFLDIPRQSVVQVSYLQSVLNRKDSVIYSISMKCNVNNCRINAHNHPFLSADGSNTESYLIGIAGKNLVQLSLIRDSRPNKLVFFFSLGGSASGKTSVAE